MSVPRYYRYRAEDFNEGPSAGKVVQFVLLLIFMVTGFAGCAYKHLNRDWQLVRQDSYQTVRYKRDLGIVLLETSRTNHTNLGVTEGRKVERVVKRCQYREEGATPLHQRREWWEYDSLSGFTHRACNGKPERLSEPVWWRELFHDSPLRQPNQPS